MLRERMTEAQVDTLEEFRSLVLDKLRQKLRLGEKQATETGHTVADEFTIGAEHLLEPLLRIRFVCEPGQVARVVAVDGPRDCSTLFDDGGRSRGRLH